MLTLHDPADVRQIAATYETHTPADVAAACERAAGGAEVWGRTPGPRRAAVLHAAATLLEQRADQIAADITREEGKLVSDARGETLRAAAVLRFHAGEAERTHGEAGDAGDPGTLAFTRRRPLGVVALVTPWNFPIAIPAWKLAPALAAGNAVVLKPSTRAPGGALALVAALKDAGLPDGVVEVVIGGADVGTALADDTRVAALSFTGSNAVGDAVRERVQARGARFQGELGGNNPLIVLADASIERAASIAVSGAFGAAGQKCTATRRVIVEQAAYEPLLKAMVAEVEQLKTGPGLDASSQVPPLVDKDAQSEVLDAIEQALGAGAEAVAGGRAPDGELAHGAFVLPTVLAQAGPGMTVVDDEVFGPVCAVLPAGGVDEAIELANATPYGLSASIVTNDLRGAFRFVERIDAGMVHVNRPTPGADPHMPFGGVKGSAGSGYREQGRAALEFFSQTKTVYVQHDVP